MRHGTTGMRIGHTSPRLLVRYLALALLAACGGRRDRGEDSATLRIAAPGDGYNTGPGSDVGIYAVNANVFETLVRLTSDYRVEPMLATRWEFRPPNSWRFHLRQGVRMHDGSAFDARAVEWTVRRIAKTDPRVLGVGDSSARVIDDSTVDITPTRPNRRLPEQLVHPNWSIVALGSDPAINAVGTGPFKLGEYVKGDHITVERFTDYWGAKAKLDRLIFRFVPDANTRALALRSGEARVAYDVPRADARELERTPGLTVTQSPVGSYEALYVNIHGRPPYDRGGDSSIRRAIAYGIDKRAIVESVWRGTAEPGQTLMPASMLGESASLVFGTEFDPGRSKGLLDDAGWRVGADGVRVKQGRRLSLTLVAGFPNAEIHKPMPEIVQAQLRVVGIEIRIVQVADAASYQARIRTGEGDLWAEAGGQNDANPCFLPDLLFYGGGPSIQRSAYARLFGPGPHFDLAIDTCRSALDLENVRKAAAAAMHILTDQDLVVIPLAGTRRVWGLSDRIAGFAPHPSSLNQRWETVWIR